MDRFQKIFPYPSVREIGMILFFWLEGVHYFLKPIWYIASCFLPISARWYRRLRKTIAQKE